ncbi:MAG: DUF4126 family protein [Solirubrobacteraceae bacterium]
MHLVFDIFQGMGIAAAIGIRPFLPGLAAGALAAGDVEIQFNGTNYSFLQSPWFLLALVIGAIVMVVLERWLGAESVQRGPLAIVLALISIVLGALFFAGSLCRGGYAAWPGFIGGAACAIIAIAATRPLLARVRARLDAAAAAVGPPLIAEFTAVLIAVLSIVAPPVGPIVVLLLLWLAINGRGRSEQKYAGLRILR